MLEPGELIDGKYLVQRLIGRGGMGAVYEGRHTLIERRVAIKVVFDDVGEAGASRFEREVRAAGRIGNDHILEIIDVGTLPSGSRYMVSEFLDGEPLSGRLQRLGPMDPRTIGGLMVQLLTGLGAAHHVGILHRDLKPDNIFLVREKAGKTDFVKIIDFGISKFQSLSGSSDSMKMTATGVVVGTPYYLSPEQARGVRDIDARSDLYAVGVIMYECATGRVPFQADSFNQLIFKIALEQPPPLESIVPGIDPWFVAIVQRAMARDPAQRFQSAYEMRDEIARWLGMSQSSGARAAAPGFDATVMAEANFTPVLQPRVPTPSSFGRTSEPLTDELLAPRRSGSAKVLLLAAPLVLVIAGAVFFIVSHQNGGEPTASSAPSATPPAASTAAVALKPPPEPSATVDVAPPRVEVETPEVPLSALPPLEAVRPNSAKRFPAQRPTSRPSPAGHARADTAPPSAVQRPEPEPPRPTPAQRPSTRPNSDRDFGY
ncbi:MAG TPA: serine/threonine-protein kinase [Polyangiaceae bacterium]|nr:serine/threonine-protein kinase [Polyangiaceae bacterium]